MSPNIPARPISPASPFRQMSMIFMAIFQRERLDSFRDIGGLGDHPAVEDAADFAAGNIL